jgi:hypothetical protein
VVIGSDGKVVSRHRHAQPTEDPMAVDRLPLAGLLAKAGGGDF